jgi:hypothetical protein
VSVERTVERKAFLIETTITGPLKDVLTEIEGEMKNYDPRGYGTSVSTIHWSPGGNGELRVMARISRSKSCD